MQKFAHNKDFIFYAQMVEQFLNKLFSSDFLDNQKLQVKYKHT